ncbi:hypothetical protein F5144DRAFT_95146 [Chaetomium tenue]|uniref:Uncharacterized protein n=1 Tax=Chaetomium tenue TaxID=1854479 RepID=A0ACB7PFS6_9PEZI|nr:hypothetical protein F5144DRAFT_95146 [Chaetomium globosum]
MPERATGEAALSTLVVFFWWQAVYGGVQLWTSHLLGMREALVGRSGSPFAIGIHSAGLKMRKRKVHFLHGFLSLGCSFMDNEYHVVGR